MHRIKLLTMIFIIAALAIGLGSAYADVSDLIITQGSADIATPGSKDVFFDFEIENTGDEFSFENATMVFSNDKGLKIRQAEPVKANIAAGGTFRIKFYIDIDKNANAGTRDFHIAFNDGQLENLTAFTMYIADNSTDIPEDQPSGPKTYRPAADFTHSLGYATAFSAGKDNTVTFNVQNRGDTAIRSAQMTIVLPEGMAVNNAGATSYIGTISIGQKVGRTFSVLVYDDLEGGKSYPVTIKVTGIDRANSPVDLENTFYIPVSGTGSGAARDIVIENVSLPAEVAADEDFTLAFSVRNTGSSTVRNIKAYADIPEGMLNKSNATFVIDSIGPGETKTFSITMYAREGSNKSIPVKIAVDPLSGNGEGTVQYAGVYVTSAGGDAKTPQLMVDQYSYGGSSILAGKEFILNLGLFNTSNKELSNIKVTIISDDGTFVPVDNSNSFFVDRIAAGGRHTQSLRLNAKPSAEQKTTGITVRMAYEDSAGGAFTAEDTISIPVMQVMRLSVDDIVPPYECYAGMAGSSTLQFYNLGKTTLNNLMVNAEGDFDIMESNSYFVGNMEGGRSDSYTFIFVPRAVGPMEGKIIFTYEDIDGEQISHEVPFTFEVMEMPVWEDAPWDTPVEKNTPWAAIIFGIILILAVAGIIIWRKIRKAKLNKKLEIEDAEFNAAMDLEKGREQVNE